jgi:hypothetical protein
MLQPTLLKRNHVPCSLIQEKMKVGEGTYVALIQENPDNSYGDNVQFPM